MNCDPASLSRLESGETVGKIQGEVGGLPAVDDTQ